MRSLENYIVCEYKKNCNEGKMKMREKLRWLKVNWDGVSEFLLINADFVKFIILNQGVIPNFYKRKNPVIARYCSGLSVSGSNLYVSVKGFQKSKVISTLQLKFLCSLQCSEYRLILNSIHIKIISKTAQ